MINNDRGQSLISKYVWVIETIYRRRKISFKELNERWLRDTDISRGVDIPKRTFDNWRYVIWDMFGISIVNENRGEYRYYIENEEDISKNGLRSWLYNTFCVSNALANSQSIKDRIILEYVPSGQDYLQPIIEAMKENRVLNMTYHSYWKDEENNFDVQPYCVKLFRQRWYMVARSTYSYYYEKGPRIYSLDRIKYLHATDETFEMPKDWTAEDIFAGCFGIIAEQSVKIQPVKLKVSAGQANYIHGLKSISIASDNMFFTSINNCCLSKDAKTLYFGCMTSVIPDGVTTIGDYAFYECDGLINIVIPNSVIEIGAYAFTDCSCLSNINLPRSVTEIGEYAFTDCI